MSRKTAPSNLNPDKQAALSGKVENDFNKLGTQKPTQKNEGRARRKAGATGRVALEAGIRGG